MAEAPGVAGSGRNAAARRAVDAPQTRLQSRGELKHLRSATLAVGDVAHRGGQSLRLSRYEILHVIHSARSALCFAL
jgi:hypothetical protein